MTRTPLAETRLTVKQGPQRPHARLLDGRKCLRALMEEDAGEGDHGCRGGGRVVSSRPSVVLGPDGHPLLRPTPRPSCSLFARLLGSARSARLRSETAAACGRDGARTEQGKDE